MWKLGLALVLATSVAHANGRPPLTNGIHFNPSDPHSMYVATTFGLLVSHDDGCTMDWICEGNIGYGGQFDPKYAIGTDGTIFATTFTGLQVSRDGGCSFTTATATQAPGSPGYIAGIWIDALDIGVTGEIWVGTAESGQPNDVYVSTDNGMTFTSRGMQSPQIWWKNVKVAPSNPSRVYIAGYQVAGTYADGGMMPPTASLLHTDDDGAHWTESPLTGVQYGVTPIVLVTAIDPTNPDLFYMISLGANAPSGDRLYRSADAGQTFTDVLDTTDPIRDIVAKDETTVTVATQVGGTWQSTDHGMTFAALPTPPELECLGQSPDGSLIGCGANWGPDNMAVTKSVDGGQTWQKVWRFVEMYGPLACPDGTAEHDMCDEGMWEGLKEQFGATGPTCGLNIIPPDAGPAGDPPPPVVKSGCCDAGSGAPISLVWAGALAMWLGRRRYKASRQLG